MRRIKEFWNKHKEIIMGALGVGAFCFGYFIAGSIKKPMTFENLEFCLPTMKHNKHVDEDIFTNIAPQIEELVLSDDCDEGLIEKIYTVTHPKYGDYSNGTYNVQKLVKVLVQDYGDL